MSETKRRRSAEPCGTARSACSIKRNPSKQKQMKTEEFVALVREMRAKQTEYFRTRRRDVKDEAMRLERLIDKAVREMEMLKTEPQLF